MRSDSCIRFDKHTIWRVLYNQVLTLTTQIGIFSVRVWGGEEVRSCVCTMSVFLKSFLHINFFFLSELNLEQVIVRSVFFLECWGCNLFLSYQLPLPWARHSLWCWGHLWKEEGCGACSHCLSFLVDTKEEPAIRIQCNMCKDGNKQKASRKHVEN